MKKSASCNRLSSFHLLAPIALLLVLAGCALGGRPPVARAAHGPAMDLAMGLYERGASLKSLAARGGATYSEGQRRHYFNFEALFMKPDKLLFTALDPAGRPAFRLASDGWTLRAILYGSGQYFQGPATAENLGRFLPLGLAPEDLTNMLTGALPPPETAGAYESDGRATTLVILPRGAPDDEGQLWRLVLRGGPGQDPMAATLESAALGPARKPGMSLRYANIKNVPREDFGGRPEPFPHSITAQWRDGEQKNLKITYGEIRLGLPLDQGLFDLPRPENFELTELY